MTAKNATTSNDNNISSSYHNDSRGNGSYGSTTTNFEGGGGSLGGSLGGIATESLTDDLTNNLTENLTENLTDDPDANPAHPIPAMVWVQPTSKITDNILCSTESMAIDGEGLCRAIEMRSQVVFQYDKTTDFGRIVGVHNPATPSPQTTEKLSPILRLANRHDLATIHQNEHDRTVAKLIFTHLIRDYNMPEMSPVSVRYTLDRTKVIFSFTAKGRVDFRALAKELSKIFRSRIEIRQIPPDYEIRQFGSVGICGRAPCCNIHPHSLGKPGTPTRSNRNPRLGPCGKTLCCERW